MAVTNSPPIRLHSPIRITGLPDLDSTWQHVDVELAAVGIGHLPPLEAFQLARYPADAGIAIPRVLVVWLG